MISERVWAVSVVCAFTLTVFPHVAHSVSVEFDAANVTLCGETAESASGSVCGFSIVARDVGPQVALLNSGRECIVSVRRGESVEIRVSIRNMTGPFTVAVYALGRSGGSGNVSLPVDRTTVAPRVPTEALTRLKLHGTAHGTPIVLQRGSVTESG